MESITIREASEKWGISARRVQYLCSHGMIPGASRFGKVWAIPADAAKPSDGRCKANREKEDDLLCPLLSRSQNAEMLFGVIEFFPYPIQVYTPDGTMVLANEASLRLMHIPSEDQIVGKFNILKDPIIDKWGEGIRKQIYKSFQGETVQFHDLRIPFRDILERFESDEPCFDASFQNITCFPVHGDNNRLAYVVHVFVTTKRYNGMEEMVKAKQYIENHWFEEFDPDKTARSVNLSKSHFSRLFKRYASMTPFSYYQGVKINKLKEELINANKSISGAFAACGMDYNGHYARLFKEKTGMTPSQYRKKFLDRK